MSKKIFSFILSSLLICQTSPISFTSVKASEKVDNAQIHRLKKQKDDHTKNKNNKSNVGNNILYLGGAAIPVAGILYYLFNSKSSHPIPAYLAQTVTSTKREILQDYANDPIACSTPIPIRNIAWWGNRCWFHSSILYYYYSNYHDAILNFPIEAATQRLISDDTLTPSERSALEAMIALAEIFIVLNGDENSPDYRKPQVVFLNYRQENDLLVKLKRFDNKNGTTGRIKQQQELAARSAGISLSPGDRFETLELKEEEQCTCERTIEDLIPIVSKLLPQWIVPKGKPTDSVLLYNGAHYWVRYEYINVKFEIGMSTNPPQDSVIDSRKLS